KHLIESAHIAGMMASELGLDPVLMKRCTVLHDIGKALTHEVQGSHALIGAEIARRYGESPDVVHAIEAHHNEVEVRTVEAVLTQAADAISGSRPGARRESLEAYVKRLERLEEIATAQEGVDKVFAMQAGREIRVMVKTGWVWSRRGGAAIGGVGGVRGFRGGRCGGVAAAFRGGGSSGSGRRGRVRLRGL